MHEPQRRLSEACARDTPSLLSLRTVFFFAVVLEVKGTFEVECRQPAHLLWAQARTAAAMSRPPDAIDTHSNVGFPLKHVQPVGARLHLIQKPVKMTSQIPRFKLS